jgi:curved DNA-binding protein CbpA
VTSPAEVLGVSADAADEEIRAAYLLKVRECPPDRAPDQFERVRDAYEMLRDPRRRRRHRVLTADATSPLAVLFGEHTRSRRFVGPGPWLEVLKGK